MTRTIAQLLRDCILHCKIKGFEEVRNGIVERRKGKGPGRKDCVGVVMRPGCFKSRMHQLVRYGTGLTERSTRLLCRCSYWAEKSFITVPFGTRNRLESSG
jgi:hypothetical protein